MQKRDVINIAGLVMFVALVVFLGGQFAKAYSEIEGGSLRETAERFKEIIVGYGNAGIVILIAMHAFQVVVSVIPAAFVQCAGGIIYGLPMAMLTGAIGIAIGTAISFYISRLLGRRIVTLFVAEKDLDRLEKVLLDGVSSLLLFILFVIPFPKDFIPYFIGLTHYKAWKLFLLSAIGRIPGQFVAAYAGELIFESTVPLIIAAAVCVVSFVLAFVYRNKLIAFIKKRSGKEKV
jgi:uncharacterized membrane protein YdjX (TVP38/TMEM64 family)